MSYIEKFKNKKKKSSTADSSVSVDQATSTTFKFLNSMSFTIIIVFPAIIDYFISDKLWYKFPTTLLINSIIAYLTIFIAGYIEAMDECKAKTSAFGYATRISSTASIIYNILYFIPPFTFINIILGNIPVIKYFANGLLLNLAFKITGMFMRC